jgi:LDH2 family malate/lactate/ureidoglycolate dehydrogenase
LSQTKRHRLDDLRHLAAALLAGSGLAPARASAFATQLLWYDQAGRPRHGIASLPTWLERLGSREVDPAAEGAVVGERTATAVYDGRNGVAPLILARAAGIAAEKARELGVGIVRVRNLGPAGPAAAVVADVALGPFAALAIGPGPVAALALPTEGGLPAVSDTALADRPEAAAPLAPWALLVPEGEWLIQAVAVAAVESLAGLHARVAAGLGALAPASDADAAGLIRPEAWEASRREARERGLAVPPKTWQALEAWAGRLGAAVPGPR